MSQEWMGVEGLLVGEAAIGSAHKAHVAGELQEKALITKETRKANEEMRLQAKKSPAPGAEVATKEHP